MFLISLRPAMRWAAISNRAGAPLKLLVVEGCRRELRLHCQTTSTFASLVQGVSILKWQMIKPWHKSKGQQWFKESTIGQSQQSFKVVTSVIPSAPLSICTFWRLTLQLPPRFSLQCTGLLSALPLRLSPSPPPSAQWWLMSLKDAAGDSWQRSGLLRADCHLAVKDTLHLPGAVGF